MSSSRLFVFFCFFVCQKEFEEVRLLLELFLNAVGTVGYGCLLLLMCIQRFLLFFTEGRCLMFHTLAVACFFFCFFFFFFFFFLWRLHKKLSCFFFNLMNLMCLLFFSVLR